MKLDSDIERDSKFLLIRSLINDGQMKYITVEGKSMVPILIPKDKVLISPANIKNIKYDDIVVFYDGEKLIIHRIISVRGNMVVTKGDNSPMLDDEIPIKAILAIAIDKKTSIKNRLNLSLHYIKKNKIKKCFGVLKYGLFIF